MAKVTVYEFEVYDPARRRWAKADGRGTLEAIERRGGVALHATGVLVGLEQLDERGFLRPPGEAGREAST